MVLTGHGSSWGEGLQNEDSDRGQLVSCTPGSLARIHQIRISGPFDDIDSVDLAR